MRRLHTISSLCRNPETTLDGFCEFIGASNIECTAKTCHYCLFELSYAQDQMRRCQPVMQQLYSICSTMRVPTWPRQAESSPEGATGCCRNICKAAGGITPGKRDPASEREESFNPMGGAPRSSDQSRAQLCQSSDPVQPRSFCGSRDAVDDA